MGNKNQGWVVAKPESELKKLLIGTAGLPFKFAVSPFQKKQRLTFKQKQIRGIVRDAGLVLGVPASLAVGFITMLEPASSVSKATKSTFSYLYESASPLVLEAAANPMPVIAVSIALATWKFGGNAAGNAWRNHDLPSLGQIFKRAISSPKVTSNNTIAGFAPSVPSVEPKTPTPEPAPKEGVSKIQRNVAQSRQKLAPDIAAGGTPTHQGVVAKSKPRRRLDSSIDTLDGFGVKKKTSDLTNSSTPSTDSKGSDEYLTVLLSIKERSLTEVQVEHTKIFNDNKEILVAYQSLTDTHYPQSFTEKEVALIKEKGGALTEQMRPLMIAANNIFTEIEDIKARLDQMNQPEMVQDTVTERVVEDTPVAANDTGNPVIGATSDFQEAGDFTLDAAIAVREAQLAALQKQDKIARIEELDRQIQSAQEGQSPVNQFSNVANDTVDIDLGDSTVPVNAVNYSGHKVAMPS